MDVFKLVRPAAEPEKVVAERVPVALFQVMADGCKTAPVPLPTRTELAVRLVVPVPPRFTKRVPVAALLTFRLVIWDPEPEKTVDDKVPVALFQVSADGWKIAPVPLPIRTELAVKLVVPIPPRSTNKVPADALLTFKLVI